MNFHKPHTGYGTTFLKLNFLLLFFQGTLLLPEGNQSSVTIAQATPTNEAGTNKTGDFPKAQTPMETAPVAQAIDTTSSYSLTLPLEERLK